MHHPFKDAPSARCRSPANRRDLSVPTAVRSELNSKITSELSKSRIRRGTYKSLQPKVIAADCRDPLGPGGSFGFAYGHKKGINTPVAFALDLPRNRPGAAGRGNVKGACVGECVEGANRSGWSRPSFNFTNSPPGFPSRVRSRADLPSRQSIPNRVPWPICEGCVR
jgi:hypothetical protein